MMSTEIGKGNSAFKRAHLRHRRRGEAPNRTDDLDDVVDFSRPSRDKRIYSVECPTNTENVYEGPMFGLSAFAGFLYAPQALSQSLQLELAFSAVSEYCESPHATNIELVPPKDGKEENNVHKSMWNLWKQENGHIEAIDESKAVASGFVLKKYRSFTKLSWSTMGYQYDWTARAYHENAKSPVPLLLSELATLFARTSLAVSKGSSSSSYRFNASACIVNYYNTKSVMGGHCDNLELALDKPVVSLSLGLPAVFLLGGMTKHDEPVVPILVRPGDVMILGGDSRLRYHGMARVLPASLCLPEICKNLNPPQSFQLGRESVLTKCEGLCGERGHLTVSDSDQCALEVYLRSHRINISVRQVLPDDVGALPVPSSEKEQ